MPPPVFKPLPGYTVQGRNGQSCGDTELIADGITIALAIIAVSLRVFVKKSIVRQIHVEDYFVIFALLLAIARWIMYTILVRHYQYGQHIWDYELPNINTVYVWGKIAAIIYLTAITCAKCSILLFYRRLFGINRKFRLLCYGLMGLVVGYCTALIFANIFQCKPISAGWDFFTPGKCASLVRINIAMGAFNLATDFLIVVIPVPLVLGLQLQPAKIFGLLAILATGFLVVAMAIVREVQIVANPNSYDATWAEAQRQRWLSVELNIGIVCTCLPLLSPLVRKIPGLEYFKSQYNSMVSLLRGGRTRSKSTSNEIKASGNSSDSYQLIDGGKSAQRDAKPVLADKSNWDSRGRGANNVPIYGQSLQHSR